MFDDLWFDTLERFFKKFRFDKVKLRKFKDQFNCFSNKKNLAEAM